MSVVPKPDPKRTAITRPAIPSARHRATASGTRLITGDSTRIPPRTLDLAPSSVERVWLEVILEELQSLLSESQLALLSERLLSGAYAAAIADLEDACQAAPRNRTLQALCEEVKQTARGILLSRIGPATRNVLACQGRGALSDGMQQIVDAARKPVSIARLASSVRGGDVAALERIARLWKRGWLVPGTVSTRRVPGRSA
jgi:hypothetical protein